MTDHSSEPSPPSNGAPMATRRRLLRAFGGIALGTAGYGLATSDRYDLAHISSKDHLPVSSSHIATATAVAESVYPSSVAIDESFIERRVFDRVEPRPGHFAGVVAAVNAVDAHARTRFGKRLTDLWVTRRQRVLASMGVTTVHPSPDGTTAERVRFFLVNDLLFALFTSPMSSDLTGIENPPGHPGGREAYRRGPDGAIATQSYRQFAGDTRDGTEVTSDD